MMSRHTLPDAGGRQTGWLALTHRVLVPLCVGKSGFSHEQGLAYGAAYLKGSFPAVAGQLLCVWNVLCLEQGKRTAAPTTREEHFIQRPAACLARV